MSHHSSKMMLLATLLPFITVAPDHWTFAFTGGLTDAHGGHGALHMTCAGGTNDVAQEVKVLRPGRVAAAVWVKGEGAGIRLLIRDADGRELGKASTTAGARWNRLAIHTRIPESAGRV